MAKLITYDYLNEISGGDKDFQREIIHTFLEEMVSEMDKIRSALSAGQWETLGGLAHKIKAPIGMLCVDSMKQLVLKVEKNAKAGVGLDELPADVNQLLAYLDDCMLELQEDLKK